MSVTITAAALIFASFLPGREAGDTNLKEIDDLYKLNKIEEAMRSFMATNRRRPCPANGAQAIGGNYFGVEASNAGGCQGGTPAAPLGPDASGYIVSGVIPTRSLHLPEEFQFDSYGRQFTYVVDKRATTTAACTGLEGISGLNYTPTGTGGLIIEDGAHSIIDHTMYAYISHGPSGYGAFPEQGSTAAGRINNGSTDQDMQINAGVDVAASPPGVSTFTTNSTNFTNVRIKKDRTFPTTTGGKLDTGFDDLLWYRNDIKNICCLGPKCIPKGFRVDSQSSLGSGFLQVAGIGDINGDGYQDLVLVNNDGYLLGWIYVIFGTKTGWPIPPDGLDPTTQLNGTNGFIVDARSGTSISPMVQVADVNADGYADLIMGRSGTAYIMFGGPNAVSGGDWLPGGATTVTASNLTHGYSGVNGQSGVTINMTGAGGGTDGVFQGKALDLTGIEIGDINKDGYNDIIAAGQLRYLGPDIGFVILGMAAGTAGSNTAGTWSGTGSIDVTTLNGTNGFQLYSSDSNILTYGFGAPALPMNGVIGDLDNDTYNDIVIGDEQDTVAGDNGVVTAQTGAVYVLYGRSLANWQSAYTSFNGNTHVIDLQAELQNSRATRFYLSNSAAGNFFGQHLFMADINNDTVPDLLVSGDWFNATAIYGNGPSYGYGGRWAKNQDIYNQSAAHGFYVDFAALPSWLRTVNPIFYAFDINSDSKPDLFLSYYRASPVVNTARTTAGAALVIYQPSGGWGTNVIQYSTYKWDSTDSFQIYGPAANNWCGGGRAFVGDVRPGDNTPEIMINCTIGKTGYGAVYGLFKNLRWPSSIDLNDLN